MNELKENRIAILGAGKLGETILQGLLDAKATSPEQVVVTAGHEARLELLGERHGVRGTLSNLEAVEGADLVLLCVKPQKASLVLGEIAPRMTSDQVLISTVASVGVSAIEAVLGAEVPVVRAMPNTPCQVGKGMTGLAGGNAASDAHLELACSVFDAVGRTRVVDEKHMDAITGLSASGPAFIYMVIESMADGGVKAGLPRDLALELAAQTVLGAGSMVIETGQHPALLKDGVTTPAGCTVDGILELEEGGLRVSLIKAVAKASARAQELFLDGPA